MSDVVIFASYGNDSVALIQWAHESQLSNVHVVYSDTGWSADYWPARVKQAEEWAQSLGFATHRTECEGMEDLVRRKKMFPHGGGGRFQFCTHNLKALPSLKWLDDFDPDTQACCMVGIRRAESRNRATFPKLTMESESHGYRTLYAPLVDYSDTDRDDLLARTPFKPLPHRSQECYPCVNCNKGQLKFLDPARIDRIEKLEQEMGINSKGNARVMFSPRRHNGAIGIRAVVDDAQKGHDDLFAEICDGGWCGS